MKMDLKATEKKVKEKQSSNLKEKKDIKGMALFLYYLSVLKMYTPVKHRITATRAEVGMLSKMIPLLEGTGLTPQSFIEGVVQRWSEVRAELWNGQGSYHEYPTVKVICAYRDKIASILSKKVKDEERKASEKIYRSVEELPADIPCRAELCQMIKTAGYVKVRL